MTIGSVAPVKEKRSRKNKHKHVVDEKSPLLPSKREEDVEVVDGFSGASFAGAVFNLSTTIVGAGIMALPATMKVLGLGLGIAMIIFVAFLTEASIEFLLRFSRAGKTVSYGGVMNDAFGKIGRILLQTSVVINNVGVLIVYMIIIGDVLSGTSSSGVHHFGILEGWFGEHWWNGRAFVLLFTTLVVFVPLGCFKRVDSLRYTSALSVALAVVFVVVTAGITIIKLINGSIAMPRWLPDVTDLTSFWQLFTVVPVLVTAYICHYNVHTIDNELEDSSQIQSIVRTSLALCSTVYVTTSFFAYLLFGDLTLDDVLANFDANLGIPYSSLLNDVVRVSYVVHLMLVFPIIFFALRLNLDGLLFPSAGPLVLDNRRFALVTFGLISLVFLGANFIPSIWDAFQFTGATAAVCIGFIFPASIVLKDAHGIAKLDKKKLDTSLSPSPQQAARESGRRMSDTLTEAAAWAWEISSRKGMHDQCPNLPPKMKNGKEREEEKLSTLSSISILDLRLYEYFVKCRRSQRLNDAPQSRAENNTGMKAVAEPRFSWRWGK